MTFLIFLSQSPEFGDIQACTEEMDRVIAEAGDRTLIFSNEGLWRWLSAGGLRWARSYLDDRFDEYRFIAYVRPPAGFLSSAFQNLVISEGLDRLDVGSLYRSYRAAFERFDTMFGRERVSLWKFDLSAFPGGDVVRDFCERLGIPLPAEKMVRVNDSLSREVIATLYAHNRRCRETGIPFDQGRRRLALSITGKTPFRLSPSLTVPILNANCEDIAWMEQRLGQSLQESLEPCESDVKSEADLIFS